MSAGPFKKRSVSHYRFLLMTRVQSETAAAWNFFIDVERETSEIIMPEEVRVCINEA